MVWRGPRTTSDDSLTRAAWAKVKAHWIKLRRPACQATRCLLPGVPIDYERPFTKPASFSAGHIVPRWQAKALGWSPEQTNSVGNSRPEHRKCNVTDGARMGQRRQAAKAKARAEAVGIIRSW